MSIVNELENSIDIVELVGRYTTLKKAGANYKAVCPFPGHNEKTPSFLVSPVKQIAYCFGCHKGGGAIKFIMDIENCEFKEAIEILGNITWIEVNTNFNKEKYEITKNLYSLYKDATGYYKKALEKNPEIKKYLFDRGLTDETIKKFDFGYANSGLELYSYLKEKGYDDKLIADSNIFLDVKSRKDKFINRIIFPIVNLRGDYVAFAGRIIGEGEPKYLNSPASNIYDKSSILYGLYNARNSIKKEDFVIITEGYMDTISLQEAGFFNTVAVSGTALTEKHLTIIKRLTNRIYLCFDGDKAGVNATMLSLENLKNKDFEVKIIVLKGGKDPDEIIKAGGDFQKFINEALTPIGFYIKKSNLNIESIDEKKKTLKEMLEIIKNYSNNIEKDFYLKELSKILNINENIIYDEFNKLRFKRSSQTKQENINISSRELAIGYVINDINNLEIIKENIILKDYLTLDFKLLLEKGEKFLESLDLDKKEKYRGIALKIEEDERHRTEENNDDTLTKLTQKINIDLYKKVTSELKEKMNTGDKEAFSEYNEIVKLAKKHGLK